MKSTCCCITVQLVLVMLIASPTVNEAVAVQMENAIAFQSCTSAQIDSSLMDMAVAPGDDFYQFANGAWLSGYSLPAGKGSYGFYDLSDEDNANSLIQLCTGDLDGRDTDPLARQLSHFVHAAQLQTPEENRLFLRQQVRPLAGARNFDELQRAICAGHLAGEDIFFAIHTPLPWETLPGNPLHLWQAGPLFQVCADPQASRDPEAVSEMKEAIVSLLTLGEYMPADAWRLAPAVLSIDSCIASVSMSDEDAWITANTRHPVSRRELEQLLPCWQWGDYFYALGVAKTDQVNLGQPDYFRELQRVFACYTLPELRAYSACRVIHSYSSVCSIPELSRWKAVRADYSKEDVAMFGGTDSVAFYVRRELPEILEHVYLRKWRDTGADARVREMVANLKTAFGRRLRTGRVLRGVALRHALEKLDAMRIDIGGPACPKAFAQVRVDSLGYLDCVMQMRTTRRRLLLDSVGQNLDPYRWWVPAYSTNAWYSTGLNRVTLPAGAVMQLYHTRTSPATQYAMLGSMIAHEMTHALDSNGIAYDARGRPKGFLTRLAESPSRRRFRRASQRVDSLYSAHLVLDSLYLDGEKELAENLADLGGVTISLEGLGLQLASQSEELNQNSLQEYFLAYAQKWREVLGAEALLKRASGWHAPPRYRTNLVLMQIEEFYRAYSIQPGQRMYLPAVERVSIW